MKPSEEPLVEGHAAGQQSGVRVRAAAPYQELRASVRPTIPAGPPLVMILSEPFSDVTPLTLPAK